MASSYPGGLDAFTNPSASDTLDSATVPHADQHSNANDAIEAIESTLGVNPQGGSATVTARLTALDSTVSGKVASVTAGDSTVTVAGTSTAPTVAVNQSALTIAESQVTNLVSDLAGKAPASGISPSAITGTAVVTSDSRLSDTRVPTDASVTDAKIATTLSASKITGTAVTQGDTGTVTSAMIANGTIVDADVSTSAAIAVSKISGLAASATTDTTNASNITSGTLPNARLVAVPNSALANSSVTVNGSAISLGGSATVTAVPSGSAGGDLTGTFPSPTLVATGTAGTYTKVTTDAQGRVTSGTTLLLSDLPAGVAKTGSANAFTVGGHTITNGSDVTALLLKGNATQTTNLFEVQNSTGTVLTSITASGQILSTQRMTIGLSAISSLGNVVFGTGAANRVGQVIQGAASQTANLQEWQNSAATVLAKVDSTGIIAGLTCQTLNNYARLAEVNTGGILQLRKATASAVPGATDFARLFIVAGTNAGTLKLVVRAGTAGAETTILDNIPQ